MSEVLCIRHGLTEWNAVFRWQGRADVALNSEGIAQAKRAAHTLSTMEPFDHLVCSPLERARDTAAIIGERLGIHPSEPDERWMERDVGEWSGLTTHEIETKWPGMLDAWRKAGIEQVPGGERESAMEARVHSALNDLLRSLRGKRALVVTHGGVLHTFGTVFRIPPRTFDNLEGRWFRFDETSQLITPGQAVTLDRLAIRRKQTAL